MRYIEYALVGEIQGEPGTKHYRGLPPLLANGHDMRTLMSQPRMVIIAEEDSSIFLYRFAANGTFAGDTWHDNVENARHQAAFEYGNGLGEWQPAPDDINTVEELVRSVGR